MKLWIAEKLLTIAFRLANDDSRRGNNLRWSVWQYFTRFRDAPDEFSKLPLHRIPFRLKLSQRSTA